MRPPGLESSNRASIMSSIASQIATFVTHTLIYFIIAVVRQRYRYHDDSETMHAVQHRTYATMYEPTSFPATICIRARELTQVHNEREILIIIGANEMCMNYDLNRSMIKLGSSVHECIRRTPLTLYNYVSCWKCA